jgi:serine/threonine protein kinase
MKEIARVELIGSNEIELKEQKIDKIKIGLLDEIIDIIEDENFLDNELKKEAENIDITEVAIEYLVGFLRELKIIAKEGSFKYDISKNIRKGEVGLEKEKIKKVLLVAVESIKKGDHPNIGDGMSASVFASGKMPEICFKLIRNFSEYTNCNSITEEFSFLDEVYNLEVNGTRAPRPRMCFECEDIHMLVMETLNAVNLEDVIKKKEKLPDNFDLEKSFKDLEEYFNILNKKYKITHGDVYPRNLMIDRESGQFYVIDFGKAERIRLDTNSNLLYTRKAQNNGDSRSLASLRSTLNKELNI